MKLAEQYLFMVCSHRFFFVMYFILEWQTLSSTAGIFSRSSLALRDNQSLQIGQGLFQICIANQSRSNSAEHWHWCHWPHFMWTANKTVLHGASSGIVQRRRHCNETHARQWSHVTQFGPSRTVRRIDSSSSSFPLVDIGHSHDWWSVECIVVVIIIFQTRTPPSTPTLWNTGLDFAQPTILWHSS